MTIKKANYVIVSTLIATLVVGVLMIPQSVSACSCLTQDQQTTFQKSSMVFTGKMVKQVNKKSWLDGTRFGRNEGLFFAVAYTFEVNEVWKGEPGKKTVIYSGSGGGECGISFQKGETYLVYAFESDHGKMYATLCTRPELVSSEKAQEDLRLLGQGRSPQVVAKKFDVGKYNNWAWFVIGFILIAVGGVRWLRKRRLQ